MSENAKQLAYANKSNPWCVYMISQCRGLVFDPVGAGEFSTLEGAVSAALEFIRTAKWPVPPVLFAENENTREIRYLRVDLEYNLVVIPR